MSSLLISSVNNMINDLRSPEISDFARMTIFTSRDSGYVCLHKEEREVKSSWPLHLKTKGVRQS